MICPECKSDRFLVEIDKSVAPTYPGHKSFFDFSLSCNDCGRELSVSSLEVVMTEEGKLSLVGFQTE